MRFQRDLALAAGTLVVPLLVLLAAAIAGPSAPTGEQAVFQVFEGGGMGGSTRTRLLLWNSGRAAFTTSDGVLRETRLDAHAVVALLRAADVLFALPDYVAVNCGDDVGSTLFAVAGSRGRKSVEACGMSVDTPRWDVGDAKAAARLRVLWQQAAAALPLEPASAPAAPPFVPDEVIVQRTLVDPEAPAIRGHAETYQLVLALVAGVTRRWSAELDGHLTGEPARRASERAINGRLAAAQRPESGRGDLFVLEGSGGAVYSVAVRPILPSLVPLSTQRLAWRLGGRLPHHPLATAYTAPGGPLRFEAVDYRSVAWWYRGAMALGGWSLVQQGRGESYETQLWVRTTRRDYESDALVLLVFQPGRFQVRLTYVTADVPDLPYGEVDGCPAPECRAPRTAAAAEVSRWYREQLGYLGWREVGPETYQKGRRELRLRHEAGEGGTLTTREERQLASSGVVVHQEHKRP